MSSSPGTGGTGTGGGVLSSRSKKVICPKVWKRPHSTIYGKNVEFGSSLYSDKLGEINGRKFNSELPWHVRNSTSTSGASGASSTGGANQRYLSKLLVLPESTLIGSIVTTTTPHTYKSNAPSSVSTNCSNYAQLLELTNPNRYDRRRPFAANQHGSGSSTSSGNVMLVSGGGGGVKLGLVGSGGGGSGMVNSPTKSDSISNRRPARVDFYEQFLDTFNGEIERANRESLMANSLSGGSNEVALLLRKSFDRYLDYDPEIGLFLPHGSHDDAANNNRLRRATGGGCGGDGADGFHYHGVQACKNKLAQTTQQRDCSNNYSLQRERDTQLTNPHAHSSHANFQPKYEQQSLPLFLSTQTNTLAPTTNLLPCHRNCILESSPYGQSSDGRKLSLGSINPSSYRPSLPHKSSTLHSSDGEEFEFQDKSSPFYTDRWAGKTIRHFDSDLYSNANLFKSMIL